MAGKLTKLAAGVLMTHYTKSTVDRGLLAELTRAAGGTDDQVAAVAGANTARHAYEIWDRPASCAPAGDLLCARVAEVFERFAEGNLTAAVVLVDPDGNDTIATAGPVYP